MFFIHCCWDKARRKTPSGELCHVYICLVSAEVVSMASSLCAGSRASGMSLAMKNFSVTVIKAKNLLLTNDWNTEHGGHFYFVLFPLCSMWLQCKYPFNQEYKDSHLCWLGVSRDSSKHIQLFLTIFFFCGKIPAGCYFMLLLCTFASSWKREKKIPKGYLRVN